MPFSELILWIYGREGPKVLIFGKLELWTRLAGVLVFLHLCATPLQQSRNTRNPNPKLLGRHHHLPNHRRYHHLTETATTVADVPEFEERKTTDVCAVCAYRDSDHHQLLACRTRPPPSSPPFFSATTLHTPSPPPRSRMKENAKLLISLLLHPRLPIISGATERWSEQTYVSDGEWKRTSTW